MINSIIVRLPEECGYNNYFIRCTYMIYEKCKYRLCMLLQNTYSKFSFKIAGQEIDMKFISNQDREIEYMIRKVIFDASLSGYFNQYIIDYQSYLISISQHKDV